MTTATLYIDTQEQLPYTFDSVGTIYVEFDVEERSLPTADYGTYYGDESDESDWCIVERKTLSDLYSTLGQHRDRFEREFERMAAFGYAALVVEADFTTIVMPHTAAGHRSQLNPKSVVATLIAWCQRYDVHLWPCGTRGLAEKVTYRILERWIRDRAN